MEPVVQHVWGWLIALYLFLGGMGGATMIVAHYFYASKREKSLAAPGALASLIMVVLGALFLILDLEKPEKFYLAVIKFQTSSWVFRGTMILSGFIVFGALYTAGLLPWFEWVPWAKNEKAMDALGLIASAFGLLVTTYTGILLGVLKAVPFWHSPALPALFVASGLATGIAAMGVINAVQGLRRPVEERTRFVGYCTTLSKWAAIVVGAEMFILALYYYVNMFGPAEASLAVNMMLFGELRRSFLAYLDFVLLGAALLSMLYHVRKADLIAGRDQSVVKGCILPLSGAILIILGGLLLRRTILEAGVMTQFMP